MSAIATTVQLDFRGGDEVIKAIEGLKAGTPSLDNPFAVMLIRWGRIYSAAMLRRFILFSRGGGDWAPLKPATLLGRKHKGAKTKKALGWTARLSQLDPQQAWLFKHQEKQYRGLFRSPGSKRLAKVSAMRYLRRLGMPIKTRREVAEGLIAAGGYISILADTGQLRDALDPQLATPGGLAGLIPGGVEVGFSASTHAGTVGLTFGQLAAIHHYGLGNVPARRILVDPDEVTLRLFAREARTAFKEFEKDHPGGLPAFGAGG